MIYGISFRKEQVLKKEIQAHKKMAQRYVGLKQRNTLIAFLDNCGSSFMVLHGGQKKLTDRALTQEGEQKTGRQTQGRERKRKGDEMDKKEREGWGGEG